jgi:hypothetical protein
MKKPNQPQTILLFVCIAILLGCTTPFLTPKTQTAIETYDPNITNNSSLTATSTQSPTSTVMPVKSDVVTASLTPLPTLSQEEALALVLDLFENDGDCSLPCWWGITPEDTSWQEAKRYLDTFALRFDEFKSTDPPGRMIYGFYFKVPEDISPHGRTAHSYLVRDNLIEYIIAFPHNSKHFTLSQLLNDHGPAEQVWLRTFNQPRDQVLPFHLVLFYPSQGFMAEYSISAELQDGSVRGCLQETQPTLWLWSPDQKKNLYDIANLNQGGFIAEELGYFRPLHDVTEMDVESFYESFRDINILTCLETPATMWPPPK